MCRKAALAFVFLFSLFPICPRNAIASEESWRSKDIVLDYDAPSRAFAVTLSQRIEYEIFQSFLEEHPNVSFETNVPLNFVGMEGGNANRLILQMASKSAPAVISFPVKAFDSYQDQGFMLPLNRFLDMPEYAWVNDYLERYAAITKVVTRDGVVYAIPTAVRTMGFHYRRDIFLRYRSEIFGEDREKLFPRTWEELEHALRVLRSHGIYGLGMPGKGSVIAWYWCNFFWQAGTEIIETKEGRSRLVLDNERGAMALDLLRRWVREDLILLDSQCGERFERGEVATLFGYVGLESNVAGESAQVDPLLLGVAPLTLGLPIDFDNPEKGRYWGAEINGGMLAVNSQLEGEAEQEIAFRLIVHSLRPEMQTLAMRRMAEAGYAKYFTSPALRRAGLEEYLDQVSPEWDRVAADILATSKPEPHGPGVRTLYEDLGYWYELALNRPDIPSLEILQRAAREINLKLGTVPPEEMLHRRSVTGKVLIVAGIVWLGFVILSGKLLSGTLKRSQVEEGALDVFESRRRRKLMFFSFLFMFPALLLIGVWGYYPLVRGSVMAFQDYHVISPERSKWVGIDNFVNVLYGGEFQVAMVNTLVFAFTSIGLGFLVPIFLALALSEIPRFKRLFRTVYYIPAVTTGLVIMFMWKWFYEGQPTGVANTLYMPVAEFVNGIWAWFQGGASGGAAALLPPGPIDWLADPILLFGIVPLPMVCVILPGIWATAGPGCLIYLAALKSIPDELYEAAEVDGAGLWRKIRKITLPMLLPLMLINLIGAFVGTFQAMGNILVMTGGGPQRMTHVLGLEIWYAAFLQLRFGYATAVAWVVGSMLIGFTVFQLNILRRAEFRTSNKVEV